MAEAKVFIGNDWKVRIGTIASPTQWNDACTVTDFGSVGEEKPLVDVTSYCDEGRAYRNGLADGVEISLKMNYESDDTYAAELYDAYKNDEIVPVRVVSKDNPTTEYFEFEATVRGWNVSGPIGAKSELTFTLKVSGAVRWVKP